MVEVMNLKEKPRMTIKTLLTLAVLLAGCAAQKAPVVTSASPSVAPTCELNGALDDLGMPGGGAAQAWRQLSLVEAVETAGKLGLSGVLTKECGEGLLVFVPGATSEGVAGLATFIVRAHPGAVLVRTRVTPPSSR